MDKSQRISRLIAASLLGQLSSEGKIELDAWLSADENHRRLYDEIANSGNIGRELSRMDSVDRSTAMHSMTRRLNASRRPAHMLRWLSAAAALLIAVGVATFVYFGNADSDTITTIQPSQISHGSTRTFIYLDNGQRISLGNDINADRQALTSIGKSHYEGTITMRTPRGGEFAMTLPDSTEVWLNAESSISYPTTFNPQLRKVAVTGEAYFKVRHSSSWPFEVEVEGQTARVLGTEFNINAYDKANILTTLFSGSLAVSATGGKQGFVLSPGETANFNTSTATFAGVDTDTAAVRGWLHGRFVFENQPLGNIMRELSRWYDFSYRFTDRSLASTVFMGSVPRYGDFREVLAILEKSGGIRFTQKGKEVVIGK